MGLGPPGMRAPLKLEDNISRFSTPTTYGFLETQRMLAAIEGNPRRAWLSVNMRHLVTREWNTVIRRLAMLIRSRTDGTSLPPILMSTWVLPRELFERSGGFCPAFKGGQGFEDSWLLLILRELGEFVYVPEVLTRYRIDEHGENADKYGHALRTFITLAKERYGRDGSALVRNARNLQCRFLLSKLAHQMDRGERLGALLTLARIARLRPAYFLDSQFISDCGFPKIVAAFYKWRLAIGAAIPLILTRGVKPRISANHL